MKIELFLLIFLISFSLSGCKDEEILKELKALNKRHSAQFETELFYRKIADKLQKATSVKEKLDILEDQEIALQQELLSWHKRKKEILEELKKINYEKFSGTTSAAIKKFLLEEDYFFRVLIRKIYFLFDKKYKHDIDEFLFLRRQLFGIMLTINSGTYFLYSYMDEEYIEALKGSIPNLYNSPEYITEYINREIKSTNKNIEIITDYLKKPGYAVD